MNRTSERICLTCKHFPCEYLQQQVNSEGSPMIAVTGACDVWEADPDAPRVRQEMPEEGSGER